MTTGNLTPPSNKKIHYFSNIRWLLTILVVMVHLEVTYSTFGLWYYTEPAEKSFLVCMLFGLQGSISQAYILGGFFFIAGYFTPASCDRKGVGRFIYDRTIRLGIPSLTYMLILHPLTMSIAGKVTTDFSAWYQNYIFSLKFLSNSGPMWFTIALLLFTTLYTLVRAITNPTDVSKQPENTSVTQLSVVKLVMFISICSFLLRTWYPAGHQLFNDEPGNFMQPGFFAQYIILYIVGIYAYRTNLLEKIEYSLGKLWFKLAIFIGIPLWFILVIQGEMGSAEHGPKFWGGFFWQQAGYATWESFFCIGILLGLFVFFRKYNNKQGEIQRFLSNNAFAVYVFHPPIIVTLAILAKDITFAPLLKMYIMAIFAIPCCFIICSLLRKIPLIKRFFS